MKKQKDFLDLWYSVLYWKDEEYCVNFEVYEIEGLGANNEISWHEKGVASSPAFIDDISKAEIYLHGEVKWDGCSNWHFDEQDRVMIHQCERVGLENIGKIMAACWDIAKEELPNFDA